MDLQVYGKSAKGATRKLNYLCVEDGKEEPNPRIGRLKRNDVAEGLVNTSKDSFQMQSVCFIRQCLQVRPKRCLNPTLFNDEPLGSKSLPRQAGKPNKPQSISKESKPVNMDYTSSVTGGMFAKEDIDEAVSEVMGDDEEKMAFGAGALASRAVIGDVLSDDETREVKSMNAMSTSEGKQLLQLLEDAVEKLSKFVNTTRVPAQTAMAPSDTPKSPPKF